MSLNRRTLHGIVWAATSGWTQFAVSLCTFTIVVHRLTPAEIGTFGIVTLAIGFIEMLTGVQLGDSLQQRPEIEPRHRDATFWCSLGLVLAAAAAIAIAAPGIMGCFHERTAASLLAWAALALPLGGLATVPNALLLRDLRFGDVSRTGALASVVGGAVGISAVLSGAGVWSLLLADFANRLCRTSLLWWLSGYRPGRPRQLGAIGDLMRFNLATCGTYLLGYVDRNLPRLLAGYLLGATAVGYLTVAQRILDLLSQLVLSPLNSVTMATVARLQTDREALSRFILSLYRLAAFVAYPAFIGAVMAMPELVQVVGHQWLPAVTTIQILLLVGMRTTTGMFNIPILRGLGRGGNAVFLLAAGALLNLVLVPVLSGYDAPGVACAVLLRTLATWPLGCWLVARATGIGVRRQTMAGAGSFSAAILVAGLVLLVDDPALPPVTRLVADGLVGAALYLTIVLAFDRDARCLAHRFAGRIGQMFLRLRVARKVAP